MSITESLIHFTERKEALFFRGLLKGCGLQERILFKQKGVDFAPKNGAISIVRYYQILFVVVNW